MSKVELIYRDVDVPAKDDFPAHRATSVAVSIPRDATLQDVAEAVKMYPAVDAAALWRRAQEDFNGSRQSKTLA